MNLKDFDNTKDVQYLFNKICVVESKAKEIKERLYRVKEMADGDMMLLDHIAELERIYEKYHKEYKILLDFAGQIIEENKQRKMTQRWYR